MPAFSYRSPKTRPGKSAIHGTGLFACEPVIANEIVAIKGGAILSAAQWQALEPELGAAEIQVADNFFIAPTSVQALEGAMLYSNHSCDPNIAISGQIVFVAMRDIAAGEELTHDWATTDDLDYSMRCNCGSSQCRIIVTGKDWMKPELQRKYRGWFAWHIQRRIDRL